MNEREKSISKKETKREQIIKVARELFSSRGIKETTVDELVRRVGISKGAFYLYFKNKKQLVLETIGSLAKIIIPEEEWNLIKKEKEFWRRFEVRLSIFLKHYVFFWGVLIITMDCFDNPDKELSTKAREVYDMLFKPILRDIQRGKLQGEIDGKFEEDILAHILFGIGTGVGNLLLLEQTSKSPEELAKIVAEILKEGITVKR